MVDLGPLDPNHHYAVDLESGPGNPYKVFTYNEAIWNISFLGPIIHYVSNEINRFGSVRPDPTVLGLKSIKNFWRYGFIIFYIFH